RHHPTERARPASSPRPESSSSPRRGGEGFSIDMNRDEFLRMIDVIAREKDIAPEQVFLALEDALALGVRKRLGAGEDLMVKIDRKTGEISMEDDEEVYEFDLGELGRIAAQAVKQVMLQKFREAERDVLYDEYENRVG